MINTSNATWLRAKKTADIRAKPMSSIIVDAGIARKVLLDTLEGKARVSLVTLLCIGIADDAWQQEAHKLLKKYDVISIDGDGWLTCRPKPENEIEFHFVEEDGVILGQWGETIDGVANLQRCKRGDVIARQPYEHADQWVVARAVFNNTYSIL